MKRTILKRSILLILGLSAILLAVLVIPTWQELRREQLDHALIAAVERNDAPTVRRLLHQGANPNAPVLPDDPRSLWQRLWDILRHKPASRPRVYESALFKAVTCPDAGEAGCVSDDNVDTVQALVDARADVNCHDERGNPALSTAAYCRKYGVMKVLLAHHVDVNAKDSVGNAALLYTINRSNADMVETLLQCGADSNTFVRDRRTSVIFFALYAYTRASAAQVRQEVASLLRHGASVHVKDIDGIRCCTLRVPMVTTVCSRCLSKPAQRRDCLNSRRKAMAFSRCKRSRT